MTLPTCFVILQNQGVGDNFEPVGVADDLERAKYWADQQARAYGERPPSNWTEPWEGIFVSDRHNFQINRVVKWP